MAIKCFWIEETNRSRVELRRYRGGYKDEAGVCSASGVGYHDASIPIGQCEGRKEPLDGSGRLVWRFDKPKIADGDPHWPTTCACGYAFRDEDKRQVNVEPIYRRIDTGEEMTLREAPAGAMYDAFWMRAVEGEARNREIGDGIVLMVLCPDLCHGGTYPWNVDGPSSNGPGWTRTGIAKSTNPTVSATPSIGCGEGMRCYHGWLRNGELVPA